MFDVAIDVLIDFCELIPYFTVLFCLFDIVGVLLFDKR